MNNRFDRRIRGKHTVDKHDDQEWQAQERALQEERLGSAASDDPLVAHYRLVARALRQPMADGLPADFARQVAAQLAHAPPLDTRFEQGLMRALAVLLTLSGVVAVTLYGSIWLQSLVAYLPSLSGMALDWTMVLATCVGLSWSLEQLRQHARTGHHASA
jgi:hypothetical protein